LHPDLKEGRSFPDITLPDHAGATRTLSELTRDHPTLLHFYRGWWCPKEQAFLRGLVALQDEMEVAYTLIVTVSVDAPETAAAFRAGIGARWAFLSDKDRSIQDRLELREATDPIHKPFLPTSFTLYPDLTIHSIYNGYWFWGRPTNEEVRRDMRAISRSVRPDWVPDPFRP